MRNDLLHKNKGGFKLQPKDNALPLMQPTLRAGNSSIRISGDMRNMIQDGQSSNPAIKGRVQKLKNANQFKDLWDKVVAAVNDSFNK